MKSHLLIGVEVVLFNFAGEKKRNLVRDSIA